MDTIKKNTHKQAKISWNLKQPHLGLPPIQYNTGLTFIGKYNAALLTESINVDSASVLVYIVSNIH